MTYIKDVALSVIHASGGFRLARLLARRRLVVLTYHHVVPTPPPPSAARDANVVYVDEFARQIAYLARTCHLVSGDELRAHLRGAPLPPHSVLITFDDGYRNNYRHAFPVLVRHGASAVFFVTSGFVGDRRRRLWFDRLDAAIAASPARVVSWLRAHTRLGDLPLTRAREMIKRLPPHLRDDIVSGVEDATGVRSGSLFTADRVEPMLWDEVRTMARAGMVIGGHTVSHQVLGAIAPQHAASEIATCRATIEDRAGCACWCFSYPNGEAGDLRRSDADLLKASGFECAFTQVPGLVDRTSHPFLLPRLGVPAAADFRVFLSRATGLHPLLTRSAIPEWPWARAS